MNLHPMLVHFPIALFTVYAVFELARFKKLMALPYWFTLKAIVLILGCLGSFAAYAAGLYERSKITSPEALRAVDVHFRFATVTIMIFGLLAIAYLLAWMKKYGFERRIKSPIVALLALIGLACVTITGALGGAMVYGTDVDPFVHFITGILY